MINDIPSPYCEEKRADVKKMWCQAREGTMGEDRYYGPSGGLNVVLEVLVVLLLTGQM